MRIRIIGVPHDLGASRRGVDMGPSVIRVSNLAGRLKSLGHHVEDAGNVHCFNPESLQMVDERVRFIDEVVIVCEEVASMVRMAVNDGSFPLVLGGDHSIAMGTVAGLASAGKRFGLIWMDAHGDFNTPETSPSGDVHGMPLASILGYGHPRLINIGGISPKVAPENTALIGIRKIDREEQKELVNSGISIFTMREIDELGIKGVMERALEAVSDGTEGGFHLSLDMDVIDPKEAPGTGTPVEGGLTYREAHLAMEMIYDAGALMAMEVVEVNPIMDISNKTGALAVDLISSALGKRII